MKMNDMQYLAAYGRFDKSVLVSAGAGSGKTQVLTTRVYELINDGISPLNLLVLTFTNAAAQEMKERVRKKINENKDLSNILPLLEQAYITTFDSFNLSICKKYYYALDVSPNLGICDSNTMLSKKQEFIKDILNDLYEQKDESFLKYLDSFTTKKDDSLVTSLLKLIDSIDKEEDSIAYLNNYNSKFYSEGFINECVNEYMNILNRLILKYKTLLLELERETDNQKSIKTIDEIILKCSNISYESFKELLSIPLPRKGKDDTDEFSVIKSKMTDLKKKIKELMEYDSLDELKDEYLLSEETVALFRRILISYYERINSFSKEYGLYEFNDIQKMAIKLVKEHIDIRNELKESFKEILIDEYQDTSDLQETFISYFSNNNLFMVGDIKQSIYRFRNANPNIFKEKYETYYSINKDNYPSEKSKYSKSFGYLIDMNQNFRSRSEVLNDINNMFSILMTSDVGDAEYRSSHMMQYGLTLYDNGKCSSPSGFQSDYISYSYDSKVETLDRAYFEGYIIAKDILDKYNKYQVYSKDKNEFHLATYDDFCIILDRGKNFDIIKQILEYYGIPTVIYADKNVTESYITSTAINLLTLVSKSYEKEYDEEYFHALTSVLRSFLFEKSDEEIFDIITKRNLDNEASNLAFNLAKRIDIISNQSLFEEILFAYDFYKHLIKLANINEALHEIEFIYNKITDLSKMGYMFKDTVSYLLDIVSNAQEIKYALDVTSSHGVKMMNIHKSKGLEFPICYFCDFNHDYNKENIKSLIGFDKKYGIYLPIDKDGIKETVIKTLVKEKFLKETTSERLRLFYVALTRAREKMIFIRDRDNADDSVDTSEQKSFGNYFDYLLEKAPNIFKNIKDLPSEYFEDMKQTNYSSTKALLKLQPNQKPVYRKLNIPFEVKEETNISKRVYQVLDDEIKSKLNLGTKYHEVLEMLDFKNLDESLESIDCNPSIKNRIKKVLNLPIFMKINEAKTYHEHEFKFLDHNQEYHGIIDLLVEYDDHFDIIDYKLKNFDDEAYDRQLNLYRSYVLSKTNKRVDCYLLSIIDANLRKVE